MYMYICICIYVYVYMYMYICICIYVYVYMFTIQDSRNAHTAITVVDSQHASVATNLATALNADPFTIDLSVRSRSVRSVNLNLPPLIFLQISQGQMKVSQIAGSHSADGGAPSLHLFQVQSDAGWPGLRAFLNVQKTGYKNWVYLLLSLLADHHYTY